MITLSILLVLIIPAFLFLISYYLTSVFNNDIDPDDFYKNRNGVVNRIIGSYVNNGSLPKPLFKVPKDLGALGMMIDFGVIMFLYFLSLSIVIAVSVFPPVVFAITLIAFLVYRKIQTA